MIKPLRQKIGSIMSFIGIRRGGLDRLDKKLVLKKIEAVFQEAKKQHPDKHIYLLSDVGFGKHTAACKQVYDISEVREELKDCVFLVLFKSDDDYEAPLKAIRDDDSLFYAIPIEHPVASYMHKNKNARKAMENTKEGCSTFGLGKFNKEDFENIMQALEITRKIDGDYVEIGVYKGASGLAALHYMTESNINRKCWFIDTFDGFVYKAAEKSFDKRWLGTHRLWGKEETIKHIENLFGRFDVPHRVITADICKNHLPKWIKKIAVCNIDVDMYDAVLASLVKAAPLISDNGIMIAEDYGHTPGLAGAHLAVKEFLRLGKGKKFTPIYMESGQMFLIKNK